MSEILCETRRLLCGSPCNKKKAVTQSYAKYTQSCTEKSAEQPSKPPSGDRRVLPGIQNSKFKIQNLILASIFFPLLLTGQSGMRSVENDAFQSGEYLKYRIYYDGWMTSWITAGYGTMTVKDADTSFQGREAYELEVLGKSAGLFNVFFKVEDRFVSYVDKEAFLPWYFIRRTHEGSYTRYDDVFFDYEKMTAKSRRMERSIPDGLQDMVSAFYYMRTIDFDTAAAGDEYIINFILDDSLYHSRIIFLGRENVETELGIFPCMKFKPSVATGEVFTEKYPMVLWVTDDKNKIPVLGKSAVYVGGVTMELVEFRGLKYPLLPLPEK